MSIEFRLAEDRDGPAIFDMLLVMHGEVALAPINTGKVARTVAYVIEHGIGIVGERDGEVVASAGLILDDWWYSDQQFLRDLWMYVRPEHRRSTAADGLLRHARKAAELWGLPLVVSVFGTKESDRKIKWMSRRLEMMGGLFYEGR